MIFLPITDSTNNYAMKRINDGLSVHGEVIWTHYQSEGKGQRNKSWSGTQGQSALFSIILHEHLENISIFELNAIIAICVREKISEFIDQKPTTIKWPNDIYIGDKKTCGILIENSFRGNLWHSAVIGIGINVTQTDFDNDLPNATSIFMESGLIIDIESLIQDIQKHILESLSYYAKHPDQALTIFNNHLYKKDEKIAYYELNNQDNLMMGKVLKVDGQGKLWIEKDHELQAYDFGTIVWSLGKF